MRQFLQRRTVACNAAADANGWIHLFDVDLRPDSPAALLPHADGFYLSAVGAVDGALELLASISGAGTQANFPLACLVRMLPGNFASNTEFTGAAPPTYEQQEMLVSGAQYPTDGALVNDAAPSFARFFPRGRACRFGFQVQPGVGALSLYSLNAELWQVVTDGR